MRIIEEKRFAKRKEGIGYQPTVGVALPACGTRGIPVSMALCPELERVRNDNVLS